MSITAVVDGKSKLRSYPCLRMINHCTCIVLMRNPEVGTVVSTNAGCDDHHNASDHHSTWKEKDFVDFNGSVTLSNG